MQKILLHELYGNLLSTLIALIVVILIFSIVNLMFIRKIETQRQKKRFRVRAFYLACMIFLFLIARIWVEGFTHLLAVLGLVSAALVVTNKETIMNFVAWLVITWRALFSEDDLIQIQQYKGYVKSIGLLYFSLSEVSDVANNHITGRIIRVPNGLVTNNPLINFSQTSLFIEKNFEITITRDSDYQLAKQYITALVDSIIQTFYEDNKAFSVKQLKKNYKPIKKDSHLQAKIFIKPSFEKPLGIKFIVSYYCFIDDVETLQQQIWLEILSTIQHQQHIALAYNE